MLFIANLKIQGYAASSVGGPDGGSQLSMASRHSSILGSSQGVEVGTYRTHPSAAAHYGGQYNSIYGSATLGSTQQVSGICYIFVDTLILDDLSFKESSCWSLE